MPAASSSPPRATTSGPPIASITAMLEAIEDDLAMPEEYLPDLRDQTRRLSALVEDLFEVARIDAGALAYELQTVSLQPIVESCLRTIAAQARAKNVRLERRGQDEQAHCAPQQVETRASQRPHERSPPHAIGWDDRSRSRPGSRCGCGSPSRTQGPA